LKLEIKYLGGKGCGGMPPGRVGKTNFICKLKFLKFMNRNNIEIFKYTGADKIIYILFPF